MASVNDVFESVTDIGDFLGVDGSGGLSGLQDAFLGTNFLKELFKILGEGAPMFASALGEGVVDVSPELADALKRIVSALLDALSGALQDIERDFPAPFGKGPLEMLKSLGSLGTFGNELIVDHLNDGLNTAVTATQRLVDRLEVTGNSIAQIFTIISGSNAQSSLLLGAIVDQFIDSIESILTGGDPKQALENLIRDVIFPKDALLEVFSSAANMKFWSWIPMPRGLLGGELDKWLNDATTYVGFDPTNPKKRSLEREYRVRIIAGLDAYLRQRLKTEVTDPISTADRRMSFETLSDVLGVLIETTVFFVLEPECFPRIDVDFESFDDIGVRFGSIAAKQLKIPIRGLIGMLLRGISFWSINNDSLIEFLGSLISTITSAVIEGVLRNLTWSLRIVGCYPNFPTNSPGVLYSWPSLETIEDTHDYPNDGLKYVALLRRPEYLDPTAPLTDLNAFPLLQNLARDIGAYIDACYLQFRIGSHFMEHIPKDTVHITQAEIFQGRLTVVATTSDTFELPQPILRAYFCCDAMPMRPGPDPSDAYTIDIRCNVLPPRATVKVLSNRGGVAERAITIVN